MTGIFYLWHRLLHRLGRVCRFLLGLHTPKHSVHGHHDEGHHRQGRPEAQIKTQPVGGAEYGHPKFIPVHGFPPLQQLAIVADVGFFQAGGKHHIQQDAGNQIGKVGRRQCHKAQRCTKGGKGDDGQHRNAGHGQHGHRSGRPALDEWQLWGADHVDDQRLAPHGLYEPSGLEHPDVLCLHQGKLGSTVMSRQIIEQHAAGHEQRAEHKVHENIRCEVEDRAGGSDPDHKAAHAGSIPFPGFGNEFLVHVIPWDGGAGEVVDEIQENEVDAHHGQEGQQRRGCQHREHIAEVGAGRHLDVFDHIGVGLAALDDALLQHHQVFFQQDDVCRLLGYVHGGIHRDADVSSFHGCSVVDTVPHKAHGVAIFPQDGHHPCLLVRGL